LDDVSKQAQSTFVLANRKQLRQTPAGITTIKPLGEEVLSNVMIQIPEKVLMRDRSVYYNCTLSSPEWGQPITMLLPESAFVHNVDLQQTVQKQLNLMGINTYVAFYDHPGYKWRDIAYCLSQRAVLKTELSALGSAPAFLLHLPRITIGPTRIDDQKHIFTMPKKATDMYSGLVVDLDDSADFRDPWIKLAEAAHKNSYIAGFLACIAHVVACMMAGAVATAEEWTLNTKHLLIVEPEAGVWLPVFQQVADLFSGGVPIPKLTLDRQLNHKLIKAFECMGDLPCAVRLHIPHGSRLSDMQLDTLPTSLVSIVDEAVAADATANPSISFVYPKNLPGDLTLLHAEDLALLRKTFPKFMQFMLKYLRTKHEAGSSIFLDMVKTLVPAHLGYQCMCEALQIECKTEVIEDTVHRMFTGGFSADIFEFFDRLYKKIYVHRRVTDHDYRMNEINVTRSPYITVTPRYVFIRKSICQYKSFRATLGDFNSTILEEELTANNLLDMTTDLNVDRRRYWVLSRETWDKFVSKPQTTYMSMSANPGGPTKIYRLAG
jgi:hypothetical protein